MGLQQRLGLRRPSEWDSRTPLDHLLNSPLEIIALWIYWIAIWLRGNPVQPPRNKKAIKIVCLSDTHDGIVDSVPEGDLLIHAGDLTNSGTAAAIQKQVDWLASLGHKHKVLIGGNHDCHLDKSWRCAYQKTPGRKWKNHSSDIEYCTDTETRAQALTSKESNC
ncbi:putative Calcineurin-like phosphoesterase [Seiridium unicorne]|uniref:Calcineurin-like phosphoesterase n=1 Tax=Seiridium unicorne TaxID=138068 RepID=A0ABR2UHE6_9PEZI